jgi:hypothetical protein
MPKEAGRARADAMNSAQTYAQWKTAALAHDIQSGAERWKREDRTRRYDFKVIRRRYDEIRSIKASGDPHALLYYLSEGIHGNTGGMSQAAVYARARFGTKDLITNYIGELADASTRCRCRWRVIPFAAELGSSAAHYLAFGRSALMLKIGAGAGSVSPRYRQRYSNRVCADVISGSGAGSFVAAIVSTPPTPRSRPHSTRTILRRVSGAQADHRYYCAAAYTVESRAAQHGRRAGAGPHVQSVRTQGRKINISVSRAKCTRVRVC